MKLNKQALMLALCRNCMNKGELAKLSGVAMSTINGKKDVLPKTLGKLAKALNVPVEELIEE